MCQSTFHVYDYALYTTLSISISEAWIYNATHVDTCSCILPSILQTEIWTIWSLVLNWLGYLIRPQYIDDEYCCSLHGRDETLDSDGMVQGRFVTNDVQTKAANLATRKAPYYTYYLQCLSHINITNDNTTKITCCILWMSRCLNVTWLQADSSLTVTEQEGHNLICTVNTLYLQCHNGGMDVGHKC